MYFFYLKLIFSNLTYISDVIIVLSCKKVYKITRTQMQKSPNS